VVALLGVGLALYALLVGGLYVVQRKLLFLPDRTRPDTMHAGVPALREVEITTDDGLRLLAWYVPPGPGAATIAYFHGNGGHIGYRNARLARFTAAGLGVLFVEYRGYGGNPGSPTEPGLYQDARAGLDFLAAQGVAPARLVLYGESLGSAVALRMATERPIAALILESPFSSIAAVAQHHYPFVPARWLIKDRFDALARVGAARAPILMLQGSRDVVVPPRFGRQLFDAAREPKELWVTPDGGHEDLRDFGALDAVFDFIRRHVPAHAAIER
jgi:fermentation-respiration switch protein FrsA (DUF1100 family)